LSLHRTNTRQATAYRRWLQRAIFGRGAAESVLRANGVPAVLDLNPQGTTYIRGVATPISSVLACNRSGASSFYTNADGTLTLFAANTLRTGTSGILWERGRTNSIVHSQEFDNGTFWQTDAETVTANNTTAPDGTATADLILESNLNNNHFLRQEVSGLTLNSKYTLSVYAKKRDRDYLRFSVNNTGENTWFNIADGTIGTVHANHTARIEALNNGWYRCSITFTETFGAIDAMYITLNTANNQQTYAGDVTKGNYWWGAQLELGLTDEATNVSSYIPTTTTALSRGTDQITFTDLSWYNGASGPGTFYAAFYCIATVASELQDTRIIGSEGGLTPIGVQAVDQVVNFSGLPVAGGPYSTMPSGSANSPTRAASTDGPSGSFVSCNGAGTTNAGPAMANYGFTTPNIGSSNGSVVKGSNYLQRMAYWNVETPSTALAAIGAPDWIMQGDGHFADLQYDFLQSRVYSLGTITTPAAVLICDRNTPDLATYTNTAGVISYFAPDTPRIGNRGLLIEPTRTNLQRKSQDFTDTSYWGTSSGMSAVGDVASAPDQTVTADLVSAENGLGQTRYESLIPGANIYAISLYFKKSIDSGFIGFGWYDTVDDHFISFNLDTGAHARTIGTKLSTPVTQTLANGWYRISAILDASGGGGGTGIKFLQNTANDLAAVNTNTVSAYWWGAQIEVGGWVTSYIPTATASVERLRDDTTALIDGVVNATWYAEGNFDDMATIGINPRMISQGETLLYIDPGSTNIGIYPPNLQAAFSGGHTHIKAIVAFRPGARTICANGGTPASDALTNSNGSTPGSLTFGGSGGGADIISGYITKVARFANLKLADATLTSLTTL